MVPEDYIQFLRSHNAGRLQPHAFDIGCDSEESVPQAEACLVADCRSSKRRLLPGWLAVAYAQGGNGILVEVMQERFGRIHRAIDEYFDTERNIIPESGCGFVANGLSEFLSWLHA